MEKRERKPNENIQVFVRLRPTNAREKAIKSMEMVEVPNNRDVVLRVTADAKLNKRFTFDRAFGPESKQNEVYAAVVAPMIEEVLSGYNCTVFAYGQTGTGKTHTMVGEEVPELTNGWEDDNQVGMVPRAVNHLFDELRMMELEFSMRVSYLELYNEECFDLLSPDETTKIRIFEDKKGGIIVHGLEEIPVHSKHDVYKLLAKGQEKRRTAPTLMNAQSSRSHTIFSIVVHMKDQKAEGEEMLRIGKLNLVDLAGSENISKAGNERGVRARETVNINQSLLTLGRVMTALVEHQPHVPYRESKLTRLLQESLGGRTKTSIIATISPGHKDYEETANTLDYAHRAKNIQNRPEVNQRLTKKTVIKEFTEEIDRLKRDLMAARNKDGVFLTEDSYNELLLGQESTTKELNEKVVQIRAIKEAMAEKEKLFAEVSLHLVERTEELKTTQENLRATGTELLHTQGKLLTTDEKYRQQRFLLKHHEHTERKLQDQAKDLLQVAEVATGDVGGLHEMVDRRRGVDAQNQAKLSQFPQRVEGQLQGFASNGHHFLGEIQRDTDGIKCRLDESCADARKTCDELSVKLSGVSALFTSVTEENLQLFQELRRGMEGSHAEIAAAVEECFVQKQRRFEEALKERLAVVAGKAERQKEVLHRIEGYAVALSESVHMALEEAASALGTLSQEEQQQAQAVQELLQEAQEKCRALERIAGEKEQRRRDAMDGVRESLRQHVARTRETREGGEGLLEELARDLQEVQVEVVAARTEETSRDVATVEGVLVRTQKSAQATEETFVERLREGRSAFEADEERVRQLVVQGVVQREQEVAECQQNVSAVQEKTRGFVGDFEDFSSNCLKTVRSFCASELETYRPTGETPAKRNFQYPRSLTQTSPHARILQRFRYDPNNSFNSTADILPGLEDDLEEEQERMEEKEEPEEEKETFEDACGVEEEEVPVPLRASVTENAENENPNVQREKKRSTGKLPANRALQEVQQRDTVYVISDDVSGGGRKRRRVMRPSNGKGTKASPADRRSPLTSLKASPAWRNC